jgi:hypothetical protein
MHTDDKQNEEVRLDTQPDEERKSEFPLGDNTVKTTGSPTMTDGVGFAANENLTQTASPGVEDALENDPSTKGS